MRLFSLFYPPKVLTKYEKRLIVQVIEFEGKGGFILLLDVSVGVYNCIRDIADPLCDSIRKKPHMN